MNRQVCIGDLRGYLNKRSIAPERLASELGLSHMTIRRWLKKQDNFVLPEKYNHLRDYLSRSETAAATPIGFFSRLKTSIALRFAFLAIFLFVINHFLARRYPVLGYLDDLVFLGLSVAFLWRSRQERQYP